MDTNWCMFCGKHIDGLEEATYCSEDCRCSDSCNSAGSLSAPSSPPPEYYMHRSPAALLPSPGLLVWAPQLTLRERSPSLTPMSAQDLLIKYPCHTPAYSTSRSSLALQSSPSLGPSAFGGRRRTTSVASAQSTM
ncbi:hypothetical protein IWQ56_005177 [Coemansia nantahalensis]|uniref:Uncharacterized protein n=2 Tax=Coemansia TaxID=4863 RepID=A0ACC1L841_9FUNG|nr:hypothetical protein IWQ56_005177 [Coemansia nantahalensis]KAJ2765519.1 hypothetical protein IWQ57_004746 [Coemansia nantahalensis]KAJ2803178.1 hypothetical protein H4R21_002131 [Coemansia helicoidea]